MEIESGKFPVSTSRGSDTRPSRILGRIRGSLSRFILTRRPTLVSLFQKTKAVVWFVLHGCLDLGVSVFKWNEGGRLLFHRNPFRRWRDLLRKRSETQRRRIKIDALINARSEILPALQHRQCLCWVTRELTGRYGRRRPAAGQLRLSAEAS